MVRKELLLLVGVSLMIFITILLVRKRNLKNNNINYLEKKDNTVFSSSYDDETGLYFIKDEETRRNTSCKL